jgi:hypothetical protein
MRIKTKVHTNPNKYKSLDVWCAGRDLEIIDESSS